MRQPSKAKRAPVCLGYHRDVRISASLGVGAIAAMLLMPMTASCGSTAPTSPTASGGTHTALSTVMLESTGPNPREITIAVGESVSFMNHDAVPHTVAGGASQSQPACSEINAVGVLGPAEIRPTAPFLTPKACDYHVPRGQTVLFSGRIVVR